MTRKLITLELDEEQQIVWASDPETGERLYGAHLRPRDYGDMHALGRAVVDVATDFSIFSAQGTEPEGEMTGTCSR